MPTNSSPWKAITNNIYQAINKTPERKSQPPQTLSINGSPLPQTFKFTPTKGKKLYPHLNPPDQMTPQNLESSPVQDINESYLNKDNQSFINAMDTLQMQLFSSNISTKVMNDFSSRYEKVREENINTIQELNNSTTNDQLNRRASGRFSSVHRNRFNRMESIAFHYAAKRSEKAEREEKEKMEQNTNHIERKLVQTKNSDVDSNMATPGDKRYDFKQLESASKRLKIDAQNFKEIDSSPTKSYTEREQLKSLYSGNTSHHQLPHGGEYPRYLQPTKASLQKSSSSKSLSPVKPSKSQPKGFMELYPTPDLQPQETTIRRGLTRSPTISPTRKGYDTGNHTPKISPSKAYSNLNKILTSSPEKLSEQDTDAEQDVESSRIPAKQATLLQTRIPRSKTMGSVYDDVNTNIPRSKTLNLSKRSGAVPSSKSSIPTSHSTTTHLNPRTISNSSSIPRLVKLANVESRVKLVSKHSDQDKDFQSTKKWRY